MKSYDVVIVGAGTAGLSARREVAKVTQNYLVVDDGELGTTCARVGCMPSKVLIEVANAFHQRRKFAGYGIHGGDSLSVSDVEVMRHVRKLRDRFVRAVLEDMQTWTSTHLAKKRARFIEPNVLDVGGEKISAKRIVLATGSSPVRPAEWASAGDLVFDTDTFFEREHLPKSLAVIGTGVLGIELGQALARLGVAVEAFGCQNGIGGLTDPAILAYVGRKLGEEVPLHTDLVESIRREGNALEVATAKKTWTVDGALLAMGRKPNLAGLDLARAGVTLSEQLTLVTNTGRIEGTQIYLAGDATGERMMLHEAADGGQIAGFNAARGSDHCFRRRVELSITFSAPNIAIVGQSHRQLLAAKTDFVLGEVSFEGQGRSIVKGEELGLMHVYGERATGRLLGAELFAPDGEHLAHLLAWAVDEGLTVFEALARPFYHPVIEEGLRTALRALAKQVAARPNDLEFIRCEDPPVN